MRHPLRAFLTALALALPAVADDGDVASALPEDIPGGRDQAAKSLKSGVPQLVRKTLEDLMFAQEEPVFAPWRPALEGKAGVHARELWITYVTWIADHDIEAKSFRDDATAWLELRSDMPVEEAAILASGLRRRSDALAKRFEQPAREGNSSALMALATNPAGHPILVGICEAKEPEGRAILGIKAAAHAQSIAFRKLFDEWSKSEEAEVRFNGVNGILRIGDPADIGIARDFLANRGHYRRFETCGSLSWIRSKEAVDLLLDEAAPGQGINAAGAVRALLRQDDPRILPLLRKLRESPDCTREACAALWKHARAGDMRWLNRQLVSGEPEAGRTLRHLLGKVVPIEFSERAPAVKKWIEENRELIEQDGELPKK